MEKEKIKVIYIVGIGRSGSTLLERIIGGVDKVWPLGEIRSLKDYIEKRNSSRFSQKKFLDEDGKPVEESFFWSPIYKEIKEKKLKLFDKHHKFGVKKFFKTIKQKKYSGDEEKVLRLVMERAQEVEGGDVDYLLDASKIISRLTLLSKQKNIELYVIHLVRDGRGVINSFAKNGESWIKILIRWIINNLFINFFIKPRIEKEKFIQLSYELFSQDPKKYLEEINRKFGLDIDLDNYLAKANQKKTYCISGNKMRSQDISEIKADQAWKKNLSFFKKMFLTILIYPFNKIWVYNEKRK